MELSKHLPVLSPRAKRFFVQASILAGGIGVMCGLLYLAAWILTGNRQMAFQFAAVVFCVVLAVAAGGLAVSEATR